MERAGDPGAAVGTGRPAPGWYPDPAGHHQARWFDGLAWTDDVGDNGVPGKDALGPVPRGPLQSPGPPTVPAWQQAAPRPTAPRLATYGARLGGWLIDWVLLAAVGVPLLLVTHSIHHTHSLLITSGRVVHQSGVNVSPGGIAVHALIVIAYGALLCGASRGQTIGMMIVGVKVVDESSGGRIGFARALGRAASEYLMAIVLFIPWIVDMLFPLWDPKNQTLHDKVVRAVVITT
jgi:uncharacterized RDD family membrane protein YckC